MLGFYQHSSRFIGGIKDGHAKIIQRKVPAFAIGFPGRYAGGVRETIIGIRMPPSAVL